MGSKFEGFEGCFKMTITKSESLQCLRGVNDRRKQLDVKIAKGTASRLDILVQLKSDLEIYDALLKTVDSKKEANECCVVVNNVITNLTKRINNLWNNIHLLFSVNNELDPDMNSESTKDPTKTIRMPNCVNCNSVNVTYRSIISRIYTISPQEDTVFNLSSSDFMMILQTTAFVDKTLMIKELFQNKKSKRLVITAPRKYGKSTNLTMLKYFLEIQVDSLGKPLTKANAEKPITDTSNYKLFKGLKISKEACIMNKHFGKYPVLYANFKIENHIKSYVCIIEGWKEVIHNAFQSHNYLQKSSKLSLRDRKLCILWCGEESYKTISDINDISIGFRSLCKCLTMHYNKPCFVLFDEPDFLIKIVSITETILEDYRKISFFMSQCLLYLKNEKLVVRAFVTGKSGYVIRGIVPSCIKVKPFIEFHEFTDYYGLTVNELEYLFKKPEFKAVTMTIKEVKDYYGAYIKIDQSTKIKKEIYCIWSILNVLKSKRIDNYWRDFGTFFCNFSNPNITKTMEELLTNKPDMVILYDMYKPISYPDFPPVIPESRIFTEKFLDYFYNILLEIGYLTFNSPMVKVSDLLNHVHSGVFVKVPNEEVKRDIKNKIVMLS